MTWHSSSLPYDAQDLELIGDHMFAVGVPIGMSDDFKARVFAAAKSYTMGNKSIDYTLRTYGKAWDFSTDPNDPKITIAKLCSLVRHWAVGTISYLMSIQGKPDLPNVFACTAAILRLKNSFRAAVLCIKHGMHIETITITRLILEQLAWVSAIHSLRDDFDKYTELSPQSCISSLKKLIPTAGPLYGQLSETSHLQFEATLSYIKFYDDELAVRLHDYELCAEDAVRLMHMIDWLEIIGEHVYSDLIETPRSIAMLQDGTWVIKSDRAILAAIQKAETYREGLQAT